MEYEHPIRRWYAKLLRLYPKPYYERFGEAMEQTFGDLLRERAQGKRSLFDYTIWMFVETSAGIIKENIRFTIMPLKKIIRVLLIATTLLLVPITASFFVDGWLWTGFDYVFAWILFTLAGLGFSFVASKENDIAYKIAVGLAVAGAFLLVWVNAAVGIIGDDNPANLLYSLVLFILIIGTAIARFKPHAMSRTLFATALAQALVPVIALFIWSPQIISWSPGVLPVFVLNGFWVILFVVSGLLFRRASADEGSRPNNKAGAYRL